MIWLLAILFGLLAAVAGWFVTAMVAAWLAGLAGMSDFEGGRAMFAFLGVGPLGGLVAMLVTIWLVVRMGRGRAPLGPTLARVAMVVAGIVVVVGAGIAIRLWSIDTYTNELPPQLVFELRVPATLAVPAPEDVDVELHTDRNTADALITGAWEQAADDHQIISGLVELAFKTRGRLLVVKLPEQPTRLYRLDLSRDPSSTKTMTDWRHANHLDDHMTDQPKPAPPDDPVELRYKVTRAGDE